MLVMSDRPYRCTNEKFIPRVDSLFDYSDRLLAFLCVRAWDLIPVLAGQANIHPARIATCGLIENKDAVNAWEAAISGSRG
jgi:hypothetical protein